jgi:hypothetical protein
MPNRLRPRLTFANVVSCLALFVALGSGAYAATQLPKNSVGTKQLKKNSVTKAKIKQNSVVTAKIGGNAVTGAKVNESTLGTVPSAADAANAGHAGTADTAANAGHADTATTASGLSAPEAVHYIGDPGEPQFKGGYENAFEGETPAGFWKDHDCMVHLFGIVKGEGGNTIFTLPASFRPFQVEADAALIMPTTDLGREVVWGAVFQEFGPVNLYFAPGEPKSVSLNGLNFRAASC